MTERRFALEEIMRHKGLPLPDAATMAGLLDIVDEGVLGASNHVALALPLIARLAAADRPTAQQEALELAAFIARTRGAGAPIVANAVAWQTEGADRLGATEAADLLAARAETWSRAAADRRRALLDKAVSALATVRSPLIYDYSSTVADLVLAMAQAHGLDQIVIPESRGIDGGRRYMTALAHSKVPVLFLPDAAIEYAASQSDALLLGAESVTRDGGLINTVGSIMSARAAMARGIPVYGAADLFKVGERTAQNVPPPMLRHYDFLLLPGERAATDAPELELVPPDLITAMLTEIGPVAPADLANALVHRKT
jgi:translation initiation factor 2B subunit (eIF-2B alpha/beta/delta family)